MPLRHNTRIIDHLAHSGYAPSDGKTIARDLRIDDEELDRFEQAVSDAIEGGLIERDKHGLLRLPEMSGEIDGKYRQHERGFGFVRPTLRYREGDLYIPRGAEGDAVTGDTVRASVSKTGRWKDRGASGRIERVLERGRTAYVGRLFRKGKQWLVDPDGRDLHDAVVVRDVGAKNAKEGQKVAFDMIHFPEQNYLGEGVITEVLGDAGRPDVETAAVMLAHGLTESFPDDVVEEARASLDHFESGSDDDREDLTGRLTFTIDPPDARDFDDALTIEPDGDGWELGVHIADVASFIAQDGPLDMEAIRRGNSVYLPRRVIPMLPEVLSNGVCSLQEGQRRWTKSVFIRFDGKGRVVGQRCCSAVICSDRRLTYLEAQALVDGDEAEARAQAAIEGDYSDDLVAAVREVDRLARVLLKRRRRDGMIELALPEVELEFDDDGHVIDAHEEDDAFTHRVIEMCMVEANEAIARLFSDLEVPLIRRTHPEPRFGDIEELRIFARSVGASLPEEPTREDLQRLLTATAKTPAARAAHFAVLRTLSRASYSPALVGHFALASAHYAHYTSPIRRYPDLLVHRVLQAYLDHTENGQNVPRGRKRRGLGRRMMDDHGVLDEGRLVELGAHCSDTERNAEEAERSLRKFLVLQFLEEQHLGDTFEGIITGSVASGVFVSLDRFLVEGMARFDEIDTGSRQMDRWKSVPGTGQLVAERSGASIAVGDAVTVQIVSIDLASRRMDVRITRMPRREAKKPRKPLGKARRKRR